MAPSDRPTAAAPPSAHSPCPCTAEVRNQRQLREALADQLHRGNLLHLGCQLHREDRRATTRGIFPTPKRASAYLRRCLESAFGGVQPSEDWVGWFLWQIVIDVVRPCVAGTHPGRVAAAICHLLAVDDRPLSQQINALTEDQAKWVLRSTRIKEPEQSHPSRSLKVRVALAYPGRPAGSSYSGKLDPEHVGTTNALWCVVCECLKRSDIAPVVRRHAGWLLAQENTDPEIGAVRPPHSPGAAGSLAAYSENPLEQQTLDLTWVNEALLLNRTTTAGGARESSTTAEGKDFFTRLQSASQILETGRYMTRQAAALDIVDMADSSPARRQACIDLLCSYIRSPLAEGAVDRATDNAVRRTIITSIRDRLLPEAKVSWQGCNLDFTDATIESGDFSHAVFSGGIVYFDRVRFNAQWFSFDNAAFIEGTVSFAGAQFNGEWMSFAQATFGGATVWFTNAAATNPAGTLTFRQARFISGHVGMEDLTVADGCTLLADQATGEANILEHAPQRLMETLNG